MTPAIAAAPRSRSSLNPQDRRLLLTFIAIVALVIVAVAILAPQQDEQDSTPSTFSSGSHGAEAAYLALERSGYRIERWEQPLTGLAPQVDANTVVIFAEPKYGSAIRARRTVQEILDRGGRVLATGDSGAQLLPDRQVETAVTSAEDLKPECEAEPEGFGTVAGSGTVHLRAQFRWNPPLPNQRVQYTCRGSNVVVTYPVGHGQVVWWADSEPLENGAIDKDGDLALLLASIGDPNRVRIVWDESLHNDQPGLWSYAHGTPVHLLWLQLTLVTILLIVSFSRRSGPLLPDPIVARDAPLEFVYSLGALYDKAGATNTAVRIAYDRFRLMLGGLATDRTGRRTEELAGIASARLGDDAASVRETIAACEGLTYASAQVQPARALHLVRALNELETAIGTGSGPLSAAR
jgi:hypothetical protein